MQVQETGTFYFDVNGYNSPLDYILTTTLLDDDFTDDTDTSGLLEIGGTVTGAIEYRSDRDSFAIELIAGEIIRIASEGYDANFSLRDSSGNYININYDDYNAGESVLLGQVEESGTYYISVSSSNSTLDYTLTATVLEDDFAGDASTTGALEVGNTATGTIDFQGDSDWFAISLTAGDVVRIASDGFFDTDLTLRDEFGNFVTFGDYDFNTNETVLIAQAQESGTFYIDVSGFSPSLEYTLTATLLEDDFASDTSTTGALEVGNTATGTIDFQNDSDWFAISLTAGNVVRIASDGFFDTGLTLRDEFGNSVAFGDLDFETNEAFLITQVEESGIFYIDVSSFTSTLDYTLSATLLEDDFASDVSTTAALSVGGTASGTIDFRDDSDWFAIELTAGEIVRIAIDGFDANLNLRDVFGNVFASDNLDFDTNETFLIAQVEESGTFYVDVSSFTSTLDYTLSATLLEDDFASDTSTTGALEVGNMATGTIDFQNDSDWFAISLTAGEVVRIASDGFFDTGLTLRDEFGNSVAFGDVDFETNEAFLIAQVEESGTFYIDVNSFTSTLDYTLTATLLEDDFANTISTSGILEVGGTATGTIEFRGDEDWFAIDITDIDSGLRLIANDGALNLSVFDATGNLVAGPFEVEGNTINFSEVGTYFVAAETASASINYTISALVSESVDASLSVADTGIIDTVADEANNIMYSLANDGTLIRFSTESSSLLPNLELGVNTSALSLSHDGQYLFAAQADLINIGNNNFEATVLRIDTVTLETESFSFQVTGDGYDITDIQATADGSLFVTTDFPGSGWSPLYNLSGFDSTFSADVITDPAFGNDVRQRTTLDISKDGQFLLLAESNSSAYPVHIYSVAAGEVIASTSHGGFNDDRNAISGEAGLVAVASYNEVTLYDFDLNSVADLTGIFGNASRVEPVFSQAGEYLLLVNEPFNGDASVAIVDTSTFEIVSFLDLPQNISTIEEVDISPDGNNLVVTDASGVHLFDISVTLAQDIEGTSNNDRLIGTEFNDTVSGLDGNDVVLGNAGEDVLSGNNGNDRLYGGDDADTLRGGSDNDQLFGDSGDDLLGGDAGDDFLIGGDGDDTLFGANGIDRLFGGDGEDFLSGGNDVDLLRAGDGNDTLRGGADNDRLFGDNGDDLLGGDGGDDVLFGGAGNDRLFGGNGSDYLNGQAGEDSLNGGNGNDRMLGGADSDVLNGGAGDDRLFGNSGTDILSGGEGADVLTGGGGADSFAYDLGSGLDSVTDFASGLDTILVDAALGVSSFGELQVLQRGANTLIRLEPGGVDAMLLLGVTASTLTADDFVFEGIGMMSVTGLDDIASLEADLTASPAPAEAPEYDLDISDYDSDDAIFDSLYDGGFTFA